MLILTNITVIVNVNQYSLTLIRILILILILRRALINIKVNNDIDINSSLNGYGSRLELLWFASSLLLGGSLRTCLSGMGADPVIKWLAAQVRILQKRVKDLEETPSVDLKFKLEEQKKKKPGNDEKRRKEHQAVMTCYGFNKKEFDEIYEKEKAVAKNNMEDIIEERERDEEKIRMLVAESEEEEQQCVKEIFDESDKNGLFKQHEVQTMLEIASTL